MTVELLGRSFDVIALYGALLATMLAIFQIVQSIREIRKDARSVKVTCRPALIPLPDDEYILLITIKAVNTGHRPVEIVDAGLRLDDKSHLSFLPGRSLVSSIGDALPKRLEDGQVVQRSMTVDEIKTALRNNNAEKGIVVNPLYAEVCDAEGKTYSVKLHRNMRRTLAVQNGENK